MVSVQSKLIYHVNEMVHDDGNIAYNVVLPSDKIGKIVLVLFLGFIFAVVVN